MVAVCKDRRAEDCPPYHPQRRQVRHICRTKTKMNFSPVGAGACARPPLRAATMMSLLTELDSLIAGSTKIPVLRTSPPSRPSRDKIFEFENRAAQRRNNSGSGGSSQNSHRMARFPDGMGQFPDRISSHTVGRGGISTISRPIPLAWGSFPTASRPMRLAGA